MGYVPTTMGHLGCGQSWTMLHVMSSSSESLAGRVIRVNAILSFLVLSDLLAKDVDLKPAEVVSLI